MDKNHADHVAVHESHGPERRLVHRSGLVANGGRADIGQSAQNVVPDPKRTWGVHRSNADQK